MNKKNYITVRQAVEQKLLTEEDCVYVVYILTILVKKMQHDSHGGGHFNINADTVLVLRKMGERVGVKLLGQDCPHDACNGRPDFDTGTLNNCFCAPECFLGRFSPASDVYSMGMLLAYMLMGTFPYQINESMTKGEILKIVRGTSPQIKVSLKLAMLIYKAINRQANKRFKDAEDMGLSVMDYLGIEKPKNFYCFDDVEDQKGCLRKRDVDNAKDEKLDVRQSTHEVHVDVDMKVRIGDGFKAVAGMEDIKRTLLRDFVEIVSHRELAKMYGIMPSNILFYGPPGTGKTYITTRLSEECGLAFCSIKPSDLGSIWVHGSQGLIKELFQKAEAKAKENKKGCILLIDEIDAVCGRRETQGKEHQADEVAEWLTQLNDCVEKNVFVVGTTNRLDAIDPALLRHGRLDSIMYIGLPDMECRKQLFEIELEKRPHDNNINMEELARMTEGYTSSDISYMVKETARNAFDASIKAKGQRVVAISEAMLRDVVKATRPSVTHEEIRKYEKMRDEYMKRSKAERPRIGFVV